MHAGFTGWKWSVFGWMSAGSIDVLCVACMYCLLLDKVAGAITIVP
jgi:hypothetical protein